VKKITIEPKRRSIGTSRGRRIRRALVFNDRRLELWIADVTTSTTTRVDTSPYTAQDSWTPSFSHDSRYLAYAKTLKNRTSAVFIYDLAAKRSFQVTDGLTHAFLPAFDPNGKYLYFASSQNAGTTDFPWAS
jgi:tricorn protease